MKARRQFTEVNNWNVRHDSSPYFSPDLPQQNNDTSKRRRTKTNRFDFDDVTNEEQRLLQQAIANSKLEIQSISVEVPPAPVLRPTIEEFKDTLGYINKYDR